MAKFNRLSVYEKAHGNARQQGARTVVRLGTPAGPVGLLQLSVVASNVDVIVKF